MDRESDSKAARCWLDLIGALRCPPFSPVWEAHDQAPVRDFLAFRENQLADFRFVNELVCKRLVEREMACAPLLQAARRMSIGGKGELKGPSASDLDDCAAIVDELRLRLEADNPATDETPNPRSGARATVNARMMDIYSKNPESLGWSVQTWADKVGCVKSTIHGTQTWKWLNAQRKSARIAAVMQTVTEKDSKDWVAESKRRGTSRTPNHLNEFQGDHDD
jgi:hypothetical protein